MVKKSAVALWTAATLLAIPAFCFAAGEAEMPRLASKSGCVTCHARTGKGGVVYSEYIQWAASIHAAKNVACEACHGGHADTSDKDKAHAGMLPASAPESPLHPKNIPAMCGSCHQVEYRHYVESQHYKQLIGNGRGANCVTCHGPMAATVPTAATVARTCEICHNEDKKIAPAVPSRAFHALLGLTEARGQLDLAQAAVLIAREKKKETAALERNLDRSRQSLSAAITEWHTFNLPAVEASTGNARDFAVQTKVQAEQGIVGAVLLQGKDVFWQVLFLALLSAALLLNLLILLKVSRRPPH